MSKILVTGGCGYIGSHTAIDLNNHGFEVISADNFSNGDPSILKGVRKIMGKPLKNYNVNLANMNEAKKVFKANPDIAGVIHFAALKSVGESVEKPIEYFKNNLNSLINIVELCKEFGVKNLIFSSSCSVYGQADALPVSENTPLQPVECPYARTKLMGEEMLQDICFAEKWLQVIALRYFNPGGAHETAIIGESSINQASNLVPVITETAIGKRKSMTVFGTDYDTRDGSAIRDYIHVMDIANAHTKAVQYLLNQQNTNNYDIINLGIGQGVTVLEAINAFETVSKKKLNYQLGPRRAGDIAAVYADKSKAERLLGWQPKYDINDIMRSAWAWEKRRSRK